MFDYMAKHYSTPKIGGIWAHSQICFDQNTAYIHGHPSQKGSLVIGRKSHNYLLAVKRGNRKIMKKPPSTNDLHGFFPWKIEVFFLQNWSPFESLPFPVDYSMGAMAQLDVLLTHDAALHAALDDLFQLGAEAFWDL